MNGVPGTIYLIHFDAPYRHAKHYLGWVTSGGLERRLAKHRNGTGARLLAIGKAAGITWSVSRTWDGVDRNQERKWKGRGKSRMCPACKETIQHG